MKKYKHLIACSLLFWCANSQAALVSIDPAVLGEAIASNVQNMMNWAKEEGLKKLQMKMQSQLTGSEIDAENAAATNIITRNGKAMEDVQNLDVKEQAEPDKDAAATLAVQKNTQETRCDTVNTISKKTNKHTKKHADFTSNGPEQTVKRRTAIDDFITTCEGLQEPGEDMSNSPCLKGSLLTGGSTIDTYDEKQQVAVDQYIELVAGVTPTVKSSSEYKNASKSIKNSVLIKEMRPEAFRSLVHTSLQEVAAMRGSPKNQNAAGRPSPLHNLTKFSDDRFGNKEWLKMVQAVHKNKASDDGKNVFPSEIMRKIAVMDAFLVHMSVLQFKQQLRMEALMAAQLALEINPLGSNL
jgi:hypothetical protein